MFAMASCVSRARLDGHPRSSVDTSTPHAWTIRVRPGVPGSDEDGASKREKPKFIFFEWALSEDFKISDCVPKPRLASRPQSEWHGA